MSIRNRHGALIKRTKKRSSDFSLRVDGLRTFLVVNTGRETCRCCFIPFDFLVVDFKSHKISAEAILFNHWVKVRAAQRCVAFAVPAV